MLSADPDAVLERLRRLCLGLPEAGEKVSHGIPAFHAGGGCSPISATTIMATGRTVVCVRTSGPDEQDMLIEADPERYSRPAYLAHAGWVSIDLSAPDPDWDSIAARIGQSHALAVPAGQRTRK